MSQRRGPKQSPFIGKRVPLVDADGQHILYKRYIDPSEVVQGYASVPQVPVQDDPPVSQDPPSKRQKKSKAGKDEATTTDLTRKNENEALANGDSSAKKKEKKKKRKHEEDADVLANGLHDTGAGEEDNTLNGDVKQGGGGQGVTDAQRRDGEDGEDGTAIKENVGKKGKKRKNKGDVAGDGGDERQEEARENGVVADAETGVQGDGEPGRSKKKKKKDKQAAERDEGNGEDEGQVGERKKKAMTEQEEEETGVEVGTDGEFDGDEGKKKKKKKKDKKKKAAEEGAAEAPVEKKLTSGDANPEEAGTIRKLLGYQGPKAVPVPGFTFQFPVQKEPAAAEAAAPATAAAGPIPSKAEVAPAPKEAPAVQTPAVQAPAVQDDGYVPRRVYVGGMPYHWEEEEIREYWSYCGEVEGLDLMRFPDTGKFRGIAFITFATQAAYESALQYNGEQLDGYTLKVDKCKAAAMRKGQTKAPAASSQPTPTPNNDTTDSTPGGRGSNTKPVGQRGTGGPGKVAGYNVAYVGNIAFEATLDDVIALFKPYQGFVRLHTDKDTKQHKGYAHVQFPDEDALDRSMELDGYKLLSRKIRVGYGQPRKEQPK